jgi:putative NIF3 family GTP cyclohydrolase 1 type 2
MTIQQIYDLAIEMAMKADPRGESFVKKRLEKAKKEFKELSEKKKKFFDEDNLINPYSDTRIYHGDRKKEVKKILAGIDIASAEVLLFDRLNEKGMGLDLLVAHHPEGLALTALHEVMDLQVDMYGLNGVPLNVSHALMHSRMVDVQRKIQPTNYNQAIDSAKLLDVPFMSLHTIWDNLGNQFILNYIKGKDYETVGEIVDDLMEIPEYIEATKAKAGPQVVSGSEKSRAGKVTVFYTGGTNPSKEIYIELAKAGVGTIIDMHMPEDAIKEMKKLHVNVINAGHMSSDSIGANIFFDELEKKGVDVVPCSGFIRVKGKERKAK